jgi:hypothetical protein
MWTRRPVGGETASTAIVELFGRLAQAAIVLEKGDYVDVQGQLEPANTTAAKTDRRIRRQHFGRKMKYTFAMPSIAVPTPLTLEAFDRQYGDQKPYYEY